jgi:chloramphenicol-sensitive protein RarD
VPEGRRGLAYGILAYLIWGAFPLYWPLLEPAGALEILAHRVIWSAVVVTAVVAATGQLGAVRRLPRRALARLGLAAVFIAVNWGTYIYGVNHHHVVETSLGYFINPLLTVALGVVLLRERLRRVQWMALGLGLLAVAVITVDYGRPPWLALILAVSFGSYGLIKKQVGVPAAQGLVVESATLALPALIVIALLEAHGSGTWTGHGPGHDVMLATSGVVTAVPLLFFAGAASRLPLSTMGLLQYLTPSLQLIVGVFVRNEPMPASRLIGFVLVWVALAILSVDGWRHRARPAVTTSRRLLPEIAVPEVTPGVS